MTERTGRVALIGAGPGDPGLISVRGLRLLAQADVVVYDRAVVALLRWARADAERIDVGLPAERGLAQDAISMLLAEKAREGAMVARLKWGDPFVFGSGAKEALFLRDQGIPFDVVPGIPAAIGAPAYAGIPVTYPGGGDALVLLRGDEGDTGAAPDVDWASVAGLDGTIVCYLGPRPGAEILQALIAHGRPPDQAAALIFDGTLPSQQTLAGTLQQLADALAARPLPGPAILVAGEVANLRDHLRWFDERPLFGRRIVVTRSREQAGELVEQLENLGAQAIEAPTFRLMPPEDPEALERAAAALPECQWIIFESANAVGRFISALLAGPRDLRAFGGVKIAAVGPSTADELSRRGLQADVIVPEFRLGTIGEALAGRSSLTGARVLVVRPDHMRETLAAELTEQGAVVIDVTAYRTTLESPEAPVVQELYRQLLEGRIDAVTFTTPTAVTRFAELIGREQAADLLNTVVVAAMGPVTAAAAREVGITCTLVPDKYTVEGLVGALVAHFRRAT